VAAETGLTYVNTGAIFREMANERGLTLNEFGKLANENPAIDLELDDRQVAIARRGGILLEGRLAGFMVNRAGIPAVKVCLLAPLQVRMKRVSGRDGHDLVEAMRLSAEREADERHRFIEFYGFDLEDTTLYDLVLDSSLHTPEEICRRIVTLFRNRA
jgi:predicted cytidylate kinase